MAGLGRGSLLIGPRGGGERTGGEKERNIVFVHLWEGGGAFREKVICCLATAAEHPAVSFAELLLLLLSGFL